MARRTMGLLESLLVDRQMTPGQLDALLTEKVEEDQFLDYKDGSELDNKKKAADTLRQYLSGFANSDGGILIIGVNDK
jgi:predicted HTH transcriptional regulator